MKSNASSGRSVDKMNLKHDLVAIKENEGRSGHVHIFVNDRRENIG